MTARLGLLVTVLSSVAACQKGEDKDAGLEANKKATTDGAGSQTADPGRPLGGQATFFRKASLKAALNIQFIFITPDKFRRHDCARTPSKCPGYVSPERLEAQIAVLDGAFFDALGHHVVQYADPVFLPDTYLFSEEMDCERRADPSSSFRKKLDHLLARLPAAVIPVLTGLPRCYEPRSWAVEVRADVRGIFMDYRTIAGGVDPFWSGGQSLVHEMGHYLGLKHPFPGGTSTRCEDGDGLADTPPLKRAHRNVASCKVERQACGLATNPTNDPRNYMDYAADRCRDRFSGDQIVEMKSETVRVRKELATVLGWLPLRPVPPRPVPPQPLPPIPAAPPPPDASVPAQPEPSPPLPEPEPEPNVIELPDVGEPDVQAPTADLEELPPVIPQE